MTPIKDIVNAALVFLEKRIKGATDKVVTSLEKNGREQTSRFEGQTREFTRIGQRLEEAVSKIKEPKFDLEVDFSVLEADLLGIRDDLRVIAKNKIDLQNVESLLKMLLGAVKENQPEKIGEKIDKLDEVFKGLKPKETTRFDDRQIEGLMKAITNSGMGGGGAKAASQYKVDRLVLTLADTEYSYAFPENTVSWTFKLRGGAATVYWSNITGTLPVSGDNTVYMTMDPAGTRSQDNMEWGGKTLYFETDTATQILEIEVYTM